MTSVPSSTSVSPWNVPNLLTASRFVLSLGVFALIGYGFYFTALVTFVIAAGTDWIILPEFFSTGWGTPTGWQTRRCRVGDTRLKK